MTNALDIHEDRQRVYAVCGGYCGGCKPNGTLKLALASCDADQIKCKYPVSCSKCDCLFMSLTVHFHVGFSLMQTGVWIQTMLT